MEEYTTWCDEEANTKEDAITSSKRTIGDLEATIEDAKATLVELSSSISELTTTISASETDLDKATALRSKEHEDFKASKKDLGFLQNGRVSEALGASLSGLRRVVEASWVNAHQKSVLTSLLQARDGDEDEQP